MAGTKDSKLKTLRIMDVLMELSDEDHPLSAPDICAELQDRWGITAERKSIYTDLEILENYGLDLVPTSIPKKGRYLGERDFELPEMRLLVDAVQAAGFISEKKTAELVAKLEQRLSKYQREFLNNQVYVDQHLKTTNETVLYTIDELARAIDKKKKVRLVYSKRRIVEGDRARQEERHFTLSPYALIWSDDHYYVICNNEKYDNFMHIRVDRIKSVTMLDTPVRNCSEFSAYKGGFDIADYAAKHFNGFSGEPTRVKLVCANELIQTMEDRFGADMPILESNDTTFTILVNVAVSEGFANWVMQFGEKVLVKEPAVLQDMILERTRNMLAAYDAMNGVR